MNYLAIDLSGRTMMILGGLATGALIILVIWIATKLYNKGKKA